MNRANLPVAIIAGLGAAVIGGGVWAVLQIQLKLDCAWFPSLLGVLVGFVTLFGARSGKVVIGVTAVLLTAVGLTLGKVINYEIGVKGEMRREAQEQKLGTMLVAQKRLLNSGALQPEMMVDAEGLSLASLQAAAPVDEIGEDSAAITAMLQEMLERESEQVSYAESRAAIEEYVEQSLASTPFFKRYGFHDALDGIWVLLGFASAFLIAKGWS
ncbi:MAG: hypothetical protein CSA62_10810 [Planctomycetota bacterium]|nr:MAG: hypothetical protein CSA62_10810 [Planctomycetota bacterium]